MLIVVCFFMDNVAFVEFPRSDHTRIVAPEATKHLPLHLDVGGLPIFVPRPSLYKIVHLERLHFVVN